MKKEIILVLTCFLLFSGETSAGVDLFDENDFFDWFAGSRPSLLSRRSWEEIINQRLTNWVKSNISPRTMLPLSFDVPDHVKDNVYSRMGKPDSVEDIIERTIVEEGLVIYDGAVGQIALTMLGGQANLDLASVPVDIYWEGGVGDLKNIRAGFPISNFIYDPQNPQAVSSDLAQKGRRGFIFRIINAEGKYNTADPLDGKTLFEEFPTWPTVHWEDWKPVAGENAWVAMAALHIYHKKNYNPYSREYREAPEAVELELAEELARAALFLQAENGGIRMAPLGTFRDAADCRNDAEKNGAWWYRQISSENNISWYAAFRMLYRITKKDIYRKAMDDIENYFRNAWNKAGDYFYQGRHFTGDRWEPNNEHFALDVQTWGIAAFGPEKIDEWFGEGAACRIWNKARTLSGAFNEEGELTGVGFINEHNRVSVEWTAGAIFAARAVSAFYEKTHPSWSRQAFRDATTMRAGIESLRNDLSGDRTAYSYSSRRGWIPFGWNSHDPEVLSLASTGWVLFVDYGFNPFYLQE